MPTKKTATATEAKIPAMREDRFVLRIVGLRPLIVHRWSQKAKQAMLDKQQKKPAEGRVAKNPVQDFEDSLYKLPDGTYGFPSVAFKTAAVTACTSLAGMTKVLARQSFHVLGQLVTFDGVFDGSKARYDLVRVYGGEPIMREDTVRVGMGTADLRYRAEFWPWYCDLNVWVNQGAMSAEQVVQLFNIAGFGVGVGDWRPEKDGMSGMFRVATESDIKAIEAGSFDGPTDIFEDAA